MIRPLRNQVFIRRTEHETTDSGIVVPLSARRNVRGEFAAEGVVAASSVDDVREGDTVFFPTWAAQKPAGAGVVCVKGEDVIAVRVGDDLRPVGDRIEVVRSAPPPDGVILTPESARKVVTECVVAKVGRGRVTSKGVVVPPDVVPGERVVVSEHGAAEIKIAGREFVVMRMDDVLVSRGLGP